MIFIKNLLHLSILLEIIASLSVFWIWICFILVNLGKEQYAILIPSSSLFKIAFEMLTPFVLIIFWIISSVVLIVKPNDAVFVIVLLLTSLISNILRKNLNDIKILYSIISIILYNLAFFVSILSLIYRFNLYYHKYELLIFFAVGSLFIGQTLSRESILELPQIINKNLLRLIILLISNIAVFTNQELNIINSINGGILLSLAFDSYYNSIDKSCIGKKKNKKIQVFLDWHNYALNETNTYAEYLKIMTQKYSKLKLNDIHLFSEEISTFIHEKIEEYIPLDTGILVFYPQITLGSLSKVVQYIASSNYTA